MRAKRTISVMVVLLLVTSVFTVLTPVQPVDAETRNIYYGASGAYLVRPCPTISRMTCTLYYDFTLFSGGGNDELRLQIPLTHSGTVKSIRAHVDSNNMDASVIYTIRVNGVDTTLSLTLPPNTTGTFTATGNIAFNSGDTITVKEFTNGGTTGEARPNVYVEYDFGSNSNSVFYSKYSVLSVGPPDTGVPSYFDFTNSLFNRNEAGVNIPISHSGTVKTIMAKVVDNTADHDTQITIRKNGVDQSLTLTIPASATGIFTASGNIPFNANDIIDGKIFIDSGALGRNLVLMYIEYEINAPSVWYSAIVPTSALGIIQETDFDIFTFGELGDAFLQLPIGEGGSVQLIRAKVFSNSVNADSELRIRKNNVDTAIVLTIPPLATGTFDSVNNGITFNPDDVITLKIVYGDDNNMDFIPYVEYSFQGQGDADSDGIFDQVDTLPATFSNDFSDAGLGGATTGTIVTRGNQILTVIEELNPAGVRAKAALSGGLLPATISACGDTGLFTLTPGDELVITCGSVTAQVISGTVEITFVASDGTHATVNLNEGNSMTFEPTTSTFTAPSTNTGNVVVIVGGEQFVILPGQTTITVTIQSFMTDSQFARISSFDSIFTPDKATSSLKLTATNPGTYFYNKIIRNTGTSPITVTSMVDIPASVNPPLSQAFCLKGSNPIQVFSDLARTVDITSQATISPSQPIANANSQSLACVSSISVASTIAAGGLRYITVHIDFNAKGSTGFSSNAATTYVQGFKFAGTDAITGTGGAIQDLTTFTAAGKKVTAVGGYAIDVNLNFKTGLLVKIFDGSSLVGQSTVTPPDGFYFVAVPAGGPYTVKLFNPSGEIPGKSASVTVEQDVYVQVDFLNLNPADPAIEGFVFDSNTQGVVGVTLNLYNGHGKLMTSTTTSASGWYAFRFTQPGMYIVEIIVPSGYTASNTSVTVKIKQFETLRVDFNLKQG